MRGFLNEIKNTALNRVSNRINQRLGSLLSDAGRGIPRNIGGTFQTNVYNKLANNPFVGETVIYPEDLGSTDQGHYIQFFVNEQESAKIDFQGKATRFAPGAQSVSYPGGGGRSSITVPRAATKRLASSICMYMPATVALSQGTKYGDHEIGGAVAAAIAGYKAYQVSDGFFDTIGNVSSAAGGEVVKSLVEGTKKAADVIAPGAKAAIDIAQGKITNNRLETVFEGVDKRTFAFAFKMMPKSEAEAVNVDKIVSMFRYYMAPSFDGGDMQSRTLISPATFDIEYHFQSGQRNDFLNRISTCVLTSCNVTYGGERTQFFRPTSSSRGKAGAPPVETSIELQFQELEIITREKIIEGF